MGNSCQLSLIEGRLRKNRESCVIWLRSCDRIDTIPFPAMVCSILPLQKLFKIAQVWNTIVVKVGIRTSTFSFRNIAKRKWFINLESPSPIGKERVQISSINSADDALREFTYRSRNQHSSFIYSAQINQYSVLQIFFF